MGVNTLAIGQPLASNDFDADINGDGLVDFDDVLFILSNWSRAIP